MVIDKFHISLFNILDELIYIYDSETLEVLFLNDKGKEILKINNNVPLKSDVKNNPFFRKVINLKDIVGEPNIISYDGCNYNVTKTSSIYNDNNVVLCVCNEIKKNDCIKEKKFTEMKDILINSVSILGKDEDLCKTMYEILEMIGLYYNADDCYIIESLTTNDKSIYCYRWNRLKSTENILDELENNYEIIKWSEILNHNEILFIEDFSFLENIWLEKYNYLKNKNINNLIVANMNFLERPVGLICIENIEEHKQDLTLLKSLVYFILNEFKRRQISKKLTFMSFHDAATGLNNRNKYINYIENIKYNKIRSMGIAFIDINGLKKINDTQGHEFGDRAIKEVSECLKRYFRKEDSFRVGGDEFVIISENISKETFFQKINSINRYFLDLMEYSVSIGYLWDNRNLDINELMHRADEYMYQAKRSYYDYIKNNEIEIYSSMATEDEEEKNKIKISLGHDSELDFSTNKFSFQSKQDIFKFKVNQIINNSKKTFVMVMLDINSFKVINEMYGFEEGNKILLKLNNIINKCIFGKGICCHSYSDVYYFCCESNDDSDILQVLNEINTNINDEIPNIKIVLSYGIYRIFDKSLKIDEIIERVSYAHKTSKKDTIRNVTFYDETLKLNMLNEKEIENDMDEALINEDFKLYLQPKYDAETNKINGAEALVRWEHSTKGLMFPGKFIPVFEKNGFIIKLDMYILEQVCKFIKYNENKGRRNIPISVNISKLNFKRKDLKKHIMKIINKYGVNPALIELEITESLIAEEPEEVIKVIEDFKKENVMISMDDFGTGYSSLSMLQSLPVDVLKIDCGFFKEFEKSKKGAAIIKSILMLAKELELMVVAEGVETKEEVEYLREIKCNSIQGYYFCKPIPLKEFEEKAFSEND